MNGTTNYMLTQMSHGGDYETALQKAQAEGYAEQDPTLDVNGSDARSKLAILASIASRTHIKPSHIFRQGITEITPADLVFAQDTGRVVKLLASAEQYDGRWNISVAPTLIDKNHPLAGVNGATNAITIYGSKSGLVTIQGAGAGRNPTAAAVIADILHAAEHARYGIPDLLPKLDQNPSLVSPEEMTSLGYIRLELLDEIGTIARIGKIFTTCGLNIKSLLQQGESSNIDDRPYTNDLITLHEASQSQIDRALARLARSSRVRGEPFYMRIAQ